MARAPAATTGKKAASAPAATTGKKAASAPAATTGKKAASKKTSSAKPPPKPAATPAEDTGTIAERIRKEKDAKAEREKELEEAKRLEEEENKKKAAAPEASPGGGKTPAADKATKPKGKEKGGRTKPIDLEDESGTSVFDTEGVSETMTFADYTTIYLSALPTDHKNALAMQWTFRALKSRESAEYFKREAAKLLADIRATKTEVSIPGSLGPAADITGAASTPAPSSGKPPDAVSTSTKKEKAGVHYHYHGSRDSFSSASSASSEDEGESSTKTKTGPTVAADAKMVTSVRNTIAKALKKDNRNAIDMIKEEIKLSKRGLIINISVTLRDAIRSPSGHLQRWWRDPESHPYRDACKEVATTGWYSGPNAVVYYGALVRAALLVEDGADDAGDSPKEIIKEVLSKASELLGLKGKTVTYNNKRRTSSEDTPHRNRRVSFVSQSHFAGTKSDRRSGGKWQNNEAANKKHRNEEPKACHRCGSLKHLIAKCPEEE